MLFGARVVELGLYPVRDGCARRSCSNLESARSCKPFEAREPPDADKSPGAHCADGPRNPSRMPSGAMQQTWRKLHSPTRGESCSKTDMYNISRKALSSQREGKVQVLSGQKQGP